MGIIEIKRKMVLKGTHLGSSKIAPKNEENKSLYQKQIKLNELKPNQIDNHSTRCFSAINPEYSGSYQQSIKRINALGKHHAMNPEEKVRKISDRKKTKQKNLLCALIKYIVKKPASGRTHSTRSKGEAYAGDAPRHDPWP